MPLEIELLKSYSFNKRDLPWRKNNDPYKVWVSEIILQQTRIIQGKKYFNDFMIDNIHAKTFNWRKDFKIDDALDKPDPHPGLRSHVHLSNFIKGWLDSCD